ncbi:MAG: hypothetical protein OXU20_04780 [Myxococcales bacterium]|nr:hypothetical protein [Myxococcales bacterium]
MTALAQQRLAHATALGTPERMEAQAQARGRAWLRGKQLAQVSTLSGADCRARASCGASL